MTKTDKTGPGWITAADGQRRFHFGAWLRSSPHSLGELSERWGVNKAHLSRCSRYERKISDYGYKRDGKPVLSALVFRAVHSATYKDYLESYDFFHKEHLATKREQERVLELVKGDL